MFRHLVGVSHQYALFLPPQPACFLLERNWHALEVGNCRETNIQKRNDMLIWRKPEPLHETWIISSLTRAPHTRQPHLFSHHEHVLHSCTRRLDILALQSLWQPC